MAEEQSRAAEPQTLVASDEEVDAAIVDAGGAREAVRNLLHDVAVLAADRGRLISHGYTRGRFYGGIDLLKLP